MMIPVRFIVANAPYRRGEVAGFPAKLAHRMVQQRVAVYLDKGSPKKLVKAPVAELDPSDQIAPEPKPKKRKKRTTKRKKKSTK